jgi:Domain of unknown function (DUF4440)
MSIHPVQGTRHSVLNIACLVFLFDSWFESGLTSDTHMRCFDPVRAPFSAKSGVCLLLLSFCVLGPGWIVEPAFAALPHHANHEVHKEIEALEMQWRQAQLSNDVGTMHITSLDLNDLKVRIYGDTAVVTSRADLEGTNGTSPISGKYRYTRVYNRRLGQWKIVSFEASHMNDDKDRDKDKDKH